MEVVHAALNVVYSVLKNGMWDDPAVANTGSIAESFREKAKEAGLWSGRVETYLTWRCSYLICAVFFTAAELLVTLLTVKGNAYKHLLEQHLPDAIQVSSFDGLILVLGHKDYFIWACHFVSFVFLVAGTVLSRPRTGIPCLRWSRLLIRLAWIVVFLLPFGALLLVPIRSLADWPAVATDLCALTVRQVLAAPGGNLNSSIQSAFEHGVLPRQYEQVVVDPPSWCSAAGDTWFDDFIRTMGCMWSLEDTCQREHCTLGGLVPEGLVQPWKCLPACVSQKEISNTLKGEMDACMNGSSAFDIGPRPQVPSNAFEHINFTMVYEVFSYSQRVAITEGAEAAHLLGRNLEFTVGSILGAGTGVYLLPMALSLLGGLTEALLDVKAVFPGLQQPAWTLVQSTLLPIPLYAVMLAAMQQVIGDQWIAITCTLCLLYLSMSAVTGYRSTGIKSGSSERERFYTKVWFEYGMRLLLVIGIVVTLLKSRAGQRVRLFIRGGLLTPMGLASTLIKYLASKILTAVAATDTVLHVTVKSELWRAHMSPAEEEDHRAALRDLNALTGATESTPRGSLAEAGARRPRLGTGRDVEMATALAA